MWFGVLLGIWIAFVFSGYLYSIKDMPEMEQGLNGFFTVVIVITALGVGILLGAGVN